MAIQYFLGLRLVPLFEQAPHGREPIAVNQPTGGGSDYPFIEASDINKIIADAYLYVSGDCRNLQFPFSIKWLYGFGSAPVFSPIAPTHSQDLLIVDAEGTTVFDSRGSDYFSTQDWSDRLRVIEWHDNSSDSVLRVVQHTAVSLDEDPDNLTRYYEPTIATLDDRVIEFVKPRVRSIGVEIAGDAGHPVRLSNGNNMLLTATASAVADGGRFSTEISISAQPGAGLGKYLPGCGENDLLIRTINGIQPDDNGNINLSGSSCYRLERPIIEQLTANTVSVSDNSIQITNDCTACCTCQDFANTYEGVRNVTEQYREIYNLGIEVRNTHADNVSRWNEQMLCRISKPFTISLVPTCNNELSVAVGYCNRSEECIENMVVFISFNYTGNSQDVDEDTLAQINASTVYTPTVNIQAIEDNGSGKVQITASGLPSIASRALIVGDQLTISGTASNNGNYTIIEIVSPTVVVTGTNFTTGEATGKVTLHGSSLVALPNPGMACGSSFRAGNSEANPQAGLSRALPSQYQPGGSYPYFYAIWDRIAPSGFGSIMFRLQMPNSIASDLAEIVVDAYSVPVGITSGGDSPVPGYEFGIGPTTAEARSYRLTHPRKYSSGLLQSNCCD
jgi:hypothetical protein